MRNLRIATKIWISLSLLILGYLVTVAVAFVLGLTTERDLEKIRARLFPATQASRMALVTLIRERSFLEHALVVKLPAAIEDAAEQALALDQALGEMIQLTPLPEISTDRVARARMIANRVRTAAPDVHRALLASETEPAPMLSQRVSALTDQLTALENELSDIHHTTVVTLQDHLNAIRARSHHHRMTNLTVFVLVMASSAITISLTISAYTLKPLARLVEAIRTGRVAAAEAYGTDEIGELAREFDLVFTRLRRTLAELRAEVHDRKQAEAELEQYQHTLHAQVRARTAELEATHQKLIQAAREAGMAQVASEVLHNVGNVLNSVSVGTASASEHARRLNVEGLQKTVGLLNEHGDDLGHFFAQDPRGAKLHLYLGQLAEHFIAERQELQGLLQELSEHVDHMTNIIRQQQTTSTRTYISEIADPRDIMEQALRVHEVALLQNHVTIERDYRPLPPVEIDRHRLLQILINLLSNARQSLAKVNREDRRLCLTLAPTRLDRFRIAVADNGVGIASQNQTKIFRHGFTTKSMGHGYGLHSAALAARDLGGQLQAQSEGIGRGATFILELPCKEVPHGND